MFDRKEYRKKWYAENKEKIAEKAKQYRKEHKPQIRTQIKEWLKTDKGRALIKKQSAIRRTNAKDFEKNTIQRVYEDNIKRYGTLTCYLCEKPILFGNDQLDHKTPISRGGTHEYCNLGVVHAACNKRKYVKTEQEYRVLWNLRRYKEILQIALKKYRDQIYDNINTEHPLLKYIRSKRSIREAKNG